MSDLPLTEDERFRFGGIARLYGESGLLRFKQARVAVIGIGGVGSWTAEALARSGVGHLTLFDLDDVCTSNINRQILALDTTVGQSKVEVMCQRLRQINPQGDFVAKTQFITLENMAESLNDNFDVIIDATDTVPVKVGLIVWCRRQKQPLIVVGGAGGQKDPRQITTADLSRTTQDPLLAKVRQRLRQAHGFSRNPKRRFEVTCVYSTEQLTYPGADGEVQLCKPGTGDSVRLDCHGGLGASCMVTASFGLLAAQQALEKIASLN